MTVPKDVIHSFPTRTFRPASARTSNYAACAVCQVDFEAGEALTVLPCKGAHAYHPACIQQWLGEYSTKCPVCQQRVWEREA